MTEIYPLEYMSVLWRQKRLFLAVFFLVFALCIIFVFNWKNYKAVATVQVAPPEISTEIVKAGLSGKEKVEVLADLQISRLKQKVLSTKSLAEIITQLNLYPEQRKAIPIAYVAQLMRKKVRIQLLSTSLANPASARKASALQLSAIAFIIGFEYKTPYLAQQTVKVLVSRFLDEDIKERRSTARKTSDFLQGQIDMLKKSLSLQEEKIAEFRAKNGDIRPDALAFNQQASIETASRLHAIQSEIMSNMGLIGTLRSQLAKTDPYIRVSEDGRLLTTPYLQLKMLKSRYASLTAKYGAQHPDVIKVSRQINAMKRNIDPSSLISGLKAESEDIQAELGKLQNIYSEDHPDVLSLNKKKASLEKQLTVLEKSYVNNNKKKNSFIENIKSDADNPAYLQILTQIEAAEKKQEALKYQREEIKKRQEEYMAAIANNPEAEKKLAALSRDYDNSIALYRELGAKKLAADISKTIEQGSIGQRLTIINSPELPRKTSPSRIMFIFVGFFIALICAIGSVVMYQILGRNVMGANHLETLIGVAPLATVPYIRSIEEKQKLKNFYLRIMLVASIGMMAMLIMFLFYIMPLDISYG